VLCVAAALTVGFQMTPASAAAAPPLRTRFDRRVDAIPNRDLLRLPPQKLVDPARQHVAHTVTDLRQAFFFMWAGAQVWAFAWLWRSGRAARVRDWLRRRIRSRWGYRAAFGAALGLLAPLAGLPFAFISYRIGFNVGLTEEVIGNWLLDYARGIVTDAIGAALAVALVLELVERTRLWYLAYLAILVASAIEVVGVNPVVFAPLATHFVRLDIAATAPVYMSNASARTRTLTAATLGIGTFTRIVIGDVLMSAATQPEIAYVVDHEDAHVRHNDDLKMALIAITLFVFVVALAVLISDRIGFRRDDDAVSRLALVAAFLGGVALLMFPLYNAYARGIEYRADEDARHVLLASPGASPANSRAAPAIRFLVRRADHDLVPLCDRRSSSWYFADHPALASRMAEMRGTEDPCPHSPATR
jgi:Zn-dependent protease with chaperone function